MNVGEEFLAEDHIGIKTSCHFGHDEHDVEYFGVGRKHCVIQPVSVSAAKAVQKIGDPVWGSVYGSIGDKY